MIKYALACDAGHEFESWFADGPSYDKQAKRGMIACPECGSTRVGKAVMAPAVVSRPDSAKADPAAAPAPLLDERQHAQREALRALRREIEANTDDVGAKFPEVARAIHAGEAPERAIRGQAKRDEVKALLEEGVDVMPIPFGPDEFN
ncbi:MAG: DUF1178 family protein [Hyphomicrobiales bacterium]|nr:DUF1178 family protein [Hyphomicrobiales bacterium]MBV8662810.1 DUF1178 family protein [Hyphomicrobiales bacterium]